MHFFSEKSLRRLLLFFLAATLGGALLYLFFRFLFPVLLPFFIAYGVSLFLQKPAKALAARTKLPRRLIASLLALLAASLLLAAVGSLLWRLFSEIGNFAGAVLSGENPLLEDLHQMLLYGEHLLSELPFSGGDRGEALRDMATDTVLNMVQSMASELGTKIPQLAARLAAAVPKILLFAVVTILSSVYFCADAEKISAFFAGLFQGKLREISKKLRTAAGDTLWKILRSYALLFLFTFACLLLGFVLLREPYAFLLALLTALVDSLPVFGTGIILFPMALYRLFLGNPSAAIGLCILYGVVTVLRQILEPRILGAGVGLPPLAMLLSMYAGLQLFGIVGMLLVPVAVMIGKNMLAAFPKKERQDA